MHALSVSGFRPGYLDLEGLFVLWLQALGTWAAASPLQGRQPSTMPWRFRCPSDQQCFPWVDLVALVMDFSQYREGVKRFLPCVLPWVVIQTL